MFSSNNVEIIMTEMTDIAGRAQRYTCSLYYCENYEFLCTPRYTDISDICTFGYMHFRFYATLPRDWGLVKRRDTKQIYRIDFICQPVCLLTNF